MQIAAHLCKRSLHKFPIGPCGKGPPVLLDASPARSGNTSRRSGASRTTELAALVLCVCVRALQAALFLAAIAEPLQADVEGSKATDRSRSDFQSWIGDHQAQVAALRRPAGRASLSSPPPNVIVVLVRVSIVVVLPLREPKHRERGSALRGAKGVCVGRGA